ncbi:unnamed protein product [Phytophthora lilii]|uniref:Unnamed protein product n=1 Tax=Phytophthora lilii TaxID=2077276 RepID=A0A9W6WUK6_9STRA|nr:unnamed protein product [Phytophthora lilii]
MPTGHPYLEQMRLADREHENNSKREQPQQQIQQSQDRQDFPGELEYRGRARVHTLLDQGLVITHSADKILSYWFLRSSKIATPSKSEEPRVFRMWRSNSNVADLTHQPLNALAGATSFGGRSRDEITRNCRHAYDNFRASSSALFEPMLGIARTRCCYLKYQERDDS